MLPEAQVAEGSLDGMSGPLAAERQRLELLVWAVGDHRPQVRRPIHRPQKAAVGPGNGQHVPRALHDAVSCDQEIAAVEEGVELTVGGDSRRGVVGGAGVDIAAAGQHHLPVGCGCQADVHLGPVGTVVARVAKLHPTAALVVAVEKDGGQIVSMYPSRAPSPPATGNVRRPAR